MEHLPRYEFQKCVSRYQGDARLRGFSCWDQYLSMGFAQLTYRESLRDIEACLGSIGGKLYHMGFRGKVARSNLADANEAHDWRIFADFAQILIGIARPLHLDDPVAVDLDQTLYALDSTTIDLCLALFPWAKFRRHKAAVKMHTLLDLRGNIPTFIGITDGKVSDVTMLDQILPEAGAFYVMDRGYIDFERLYVFTLSAAFFVTRTKENVLLQRRYSHKVDTSTGVYSDHTVILTAIKSINRRAEVEGYRQCTAHRTNGAVERKLPQGQVLIQTLESPHRAEDSQRHRQVEPRPFPAHVRGGQIHGNCLIRIAETGIDQCRFNPLPALAHRRIRHAHDQKLFAIPLRNRSTTTSTGWASIP